MCYALGMKKKSNECLVQLLYGYEITGAVTERSDINFTMKQLLISKKMAEEARFTVLEICRNLDSLDDEIENISKDYEFERISKIDLTILRWSFYLINQEDFEKANLINEAIRLSKKFSTVEASKFVHAILDEKINGESQVPATV